MDRDYFRKYFRGYYYRKKLEYLSLLGGVCVKCGSTDRLEFDHVNPEEKLFSITKFLSYPEDTVLEELKKCQLLCKSCHIVKTYPDKRHGTTTMYRVGCRCELCSEANTEYHRKWKSARLAC